MDIGAAVQALKDGHRVARSGWNGKGMYLFLVPGAKEVVNEIPVEVAPAVAMKTATGIVQPGWLCSQNDLLSTDWVVV